MFRLFGKKKYIPAITEEDRIWIEENFLWFIEVFGLDKLKKEPFILSTADIFPYDNLYDSGQFQQLFEQICKYWDVNPDEIVVKFFDDYRSLEWTTWTPQADSGQPIGLYYRSYTSEGKRFNVLLAKSNLKHPQLLVTVLSHELGHVKLLGDNYMQENNTDKESFTDLASIFFGFGIFVANCIQIQEINWMGRVGYLPNEVISYANALICYITGHNADDYYMYFNSNTRELFKKDFEYLIDTNNTILTKRKVAQGESYYRIVNELNACYDKRQFDDVIKFGKQLIEIKPKDIFANNYIGYALLQQKKYKEAINQFTKSIDIDIYSDYSYTQRGYCKLQLNEMENAFADIHSAIQMNQESAYAWRNMGVYYFMINDLDNAIYYLEEAEKIDNKTGLINFYLSKTYSKLGNDEKAKYYMELSIEKKEHNDSIIT